MEKQKMIDRRISRRGIEYIAKQEGLRLEAYRDTGGVWTIGYGHTGPEVKKGLKITKAQALEIFQKDLEIYEKSVCDAVKDKVVMQNELDAMISLCFNIGTKAFTKSTFLKIFREGKYAAAAMEMLAWCWDNGKPTLVKRRISDAKLFSEGNIVLLQQIERLEILLNKLATR